MAIEMTGAHTNARVMVEDESLVEQQCREQIQELIDHPAFTEPVRVMPDTHWGAGAPIGFTMPLGDRIAPADSIESGVARHGYFRTTPVAIPLKRRLSGTTTASTSLLDRRPRRHRLRDRRPASGG